MARQNSPNRESMPWWAFAAVAMALVGYHEVLVDNHQLAQREKSASFTKTIRHDELRRLRRMQDEGNDTKEAAHDTIDDAVEDQNDTKSDVDGAAEGNKTTQIDQDDTKTDVVDDAATASTDPFANDNVTVQIPCALNMFSPCGNVIIPPEGLTIKTAFAGEHFIPGAEELGPKVKMFRHAFSEWTMIILGALLAFWILQTLIRTKKRNKLIKSIKDMFDGEVEEADEADEADPPTKEEIEEERLERLKVDSENFIAPGNVYRLLAVMHPGVCGFGPYCHLAFKALVVAYMQVYLPVSIIKHTLTTWQFFYIKSPIWFLNNSFTFATMFASLASLCNLFAEKCAQNIAVGALANKHILTHRAPDAEQASPTERGPLLPTTEAGASAAASAAAKAAANPMALLGSIKTPMPGWVICANEYFWCSLSMVMNIVMSTLLQLCMFLKVATFTGAVDQVAIVAVSLYFVFDLDNKVMQSDANLKKRYRRLVAKQTEVRDANPKLLLRIASAAIGFVRLLVPAGLCAIILFGWKNNETGFIIGGDSFE